MKKIVFPLVALVLAIGLAVPTGLPTLAQAPTFTGDVEVDFPPGPGVLIIPDPGGQGDVGLPVGAPIGTISGWDMKDLRLAYDLATDTMFVGINTYGIASDADGDGDPSVTTAWLAAAGGADLADVSDTECFAVYFDLNQDGDLDVIAGVSGSANITGFSVNVPLTTSFPGNPPFNFGAPLPANTGIVFSSPSAGAPDVEFTITNFSTLPGYDAMRSYCVGAFLGSLQDDGIGEDSLRYCLQSLGTRVTISANASVVPVGGTVELTITETNTGSVNLTSVHVEVEANGVPIADLGDPPDSGDDQLPNPDDGILQPLETWEWIRSYVVNGPITFEAIGRGTDPAGNIVTYCEDPGSPPEGVICDDKEMATVSVRPPGNGVGGDVYPIDKTNLLVPWIGLALIVVVATGAGVLVLRRRRSA